MFRNGRRGRSVDGGDDVGHQCVEFEVDLGDELFEALVVNPNISLTIQDERPRCRAVILDGVAALSRLADTDNPTAGMATRYFGRVGATAYDKMAAEVYEASGLTLITHVPKEVKGLDNTKALTRPELAFVRMREHLPVPWALL